MNIESALHEGITAVGHRDARLFLSHITGYSTNGLYLNSTKAISQDEYNLYKSYLERRLEGEPLQYIIGEWDFMGLTLYTDKRALIPRPETELLVEEAFYFLNKLKKNPVKVLDLCTGSGCIALALACLTDGSVSITAVDICAEALELAKENAEKFGLEDDRITFIQSDLLENVSDKFDIIISNPPYILSGDIIGLNKSVRDYEPHTALDGGADGLDFYRRLIPQCKNALNDGGALFLEIGPVKARDLMSEAGFENINLIRDYSEFERILTGEKKQ
jgi:release factor glutamine methyltransferase